MEQNLEKDCSAIGGLFMTIMSDMRGHSPVFEDFTTKATKLHSSLKATLIAIAAFLDAFQKIADMATSSRGATKEIGSALTRLCLRHKAIESKLKRFTGTILDHLVNPIQDRLEEWKKTVVQLDKEHAKDYKRAKAEIKRCAADTVKLQKKVKKGKNDMQSRLDGAMHEVNDKYMLLEEAEKNAVRTSLIEERGRFCLFISCIKPFVDGEVSLLTEITHLQEIMDSLCQQADNPESLPPSSEQVIIDLKVLDKTSWNLQTPPSSPSSLGSRKSSMCSINSINSSSSGSTQSHSPSHHHNSHIAQAQLAGSLRLTSVSSQDSGFTSQDTLFLRPTTPSSLNIHSQQSDNISNDTDTPEIGSTPSTPSESYPNTPSASSTWTNWPNAPNTDRLPEGGRPHTISTAYEKTHTRPALTSQLFEPPAPGMLESKQSSSKEDVHDSMVVKRDRPHSTMSVPYSRPPASINKMQPVLPPLGPKPKSRAVAPPQIPPIGEQPVYANLVGLGGEISPDPNSVDSDTDRTPTTVNPPTSNSSNVQYNDEMDLTEAIRDLDNFTAALRGDFSQNPVERKSQMEQNNMQLAAAIKELEASTAALEKSYDTDSQASRSSLQCSSGYGTMNSTPAGSEDTIASGVVDIRTGYRMADYIDTEQRDYYGSEQEKYFTIPRNSNMSSMYRAAFQSKRPASTAGIPVSAGLTRRSSLNTPKPPPPVRRSSSITAAPNPAVLNKLRASPPRHLNTQAEMQSQPQAQSDGLHSNAQYQGNHRRTRSASNSSELSEPAYAELADIQQSIQARQQQQQMEGQCRGQIDYGQGYAGGRPNISAPVSPQYAIPVTNHLNQCGTANVIDSLNLKFAALNAQNSQNIHGSKSSPNFVAKPGGSEQGFPPPPAAEDFPDLPPPPTDDELLAMESSYPVPKQPVTQTNVQNNAVQMRRIQQTPQNPLPDPTVQNNALQMRRVQRAQQNPLQDPTVQNNAAQMRRVQQPTVQNNAAQMRRVQQTQQNPLPDPAGMRQSLISEMKKMKFKKKSNSEDSEC